ncbi:MAG: hypothetical protein Q9162_003279 [Coniocarpon cinnabarinum]
MSLSRTPSPQQGGGWSSPGLVAPRSKHGSPARRSPSPRGHFADEPHQATWTTAQARSREVKGFETKRKSWIPRNLSVSLPRFINQNAWNTQNKYATKEKVNRGRIPQNNMERLRMLGAVLTRGAFRFRAQLAILLCFLLIVILYYKTSAHQLYRRTGFLGGGNKFVVILATNVGGGVMEWKGPREWAIERDSVRNKKRYAAQHGYYLEIVDMSTKKRYAHEWREGWEKVDTIRRCMREYPSAEW